VLSEADQRSLLSQDLKSGKDLIQTPFGQLPSISEKVGCLAVQPAGMCDAGWWSSVGVTGRSMSAAVLQRMRRTIQLHTVACVAPAPAGLMVSCPRACALLVAGPSED
jgi:hypothetical protein